MLLSSSADDYLCFDWSGKQDKAGDFALFFKTAWFFVVFLVVFAVVDTFLIKSSFLTDWLLVAATLGFFFTEVILYTYLAVLVSKIFNPQGYMTFLIAFNKEIRSLLDTILNNGV